MEGVNYKATSLPKSKVIEDSKKDGPIHKAACDGHLEAVMELLDQGVAVDTRGDLGYTPLQYAAKYGRLDVVRRLVERGADLNLANDYSWTPLHHAAHYSRYEIAKFLIDAGADTQIVDTVYEMTPRSWSKNDCKMVNVFKSRGINT